MDLKEPLGKKLQEKDFIQDSFRKNPFPFWIWLVILTCLMAIIWGSGQWYSSFINNAIERNPFLQVTNREISIFLWQFPEYMRINVKNKQGYLPGFQYEENKVSMALSESDKYVVAPPELIFLYHTWHRLISQEFTSRPISIKEFQEFLQEMPEWQPPHWPKAPQSYIALVESLKTNSSLHDFIEDKDGNLPTEVRQSFQGWKNYFKEGNAINTIQAKTEEMQRFLKAKPHYARNYWINIVKDHYPFYLQSLKNYHLQNQVIPSQEIPPFLKVAYYNYIESL
jgi:hypothetical protein